MNDAETRVLMWAAVLSAAAVAMMAVRREFFDDSVAVIASAPQPESFLEDWKEMAKVGHRLGPPNAPVTIIEFADFQCPICAQFAKNGLAEILRQFGDDISIVYRHWPLSYHAEAFPAARASECAAEQGRFWEYHDALFAGQSQLGVKSYTQFAAESGVEDTVAFEACLQGTMYDERIEADRAVAEAISARGTPTLVINGRQFSGAPDSARFARLIESALDGLED